MEIENNTCICRCTHRHLHAVALTTHTQAYFCIREFSIQAPNVSFKSKSNHCIKIIMFLLIGACRILCSNDGAWWIAINN